MTGEVVCGEDVSEVVLLVLLVGCPSPNPKAQGQGQGQAPKAKPQAEPNGARRFRLSLHTYMLQLTHLRAT